MKITKRKLKKLIKEQIYYGENYGRKEYSLLSRIFPTLPPLITAINAAFKTRSIDPSLVPGVYDNWKPLIGKPKLKVKEYKHDLVDLILDRFYASKDPDVVRYLYKWICVFYKEYKEFEKVFKTIMKPKFFPFGGDSDLWYPDLEYGSNERIDEYIESGYFSSHGGSGIPFMWKV